MNVPWIGRVLVPGTVRERTVRVWTDGRPPQPSDRVQEIVCPFAAARPNAGADRHGDPWQFATTLSPVAAGLDGPLQAYELAPPVRPGKIIAVGRNFRAHAEELGNEVPEEPLLFFKPSSALLADGQPLHLPGGFDRIDFEGELVVVIGRVGRGFAEEDALDHIGGYTLGNDISCRDLQRRDKQWTRAKGFDGFAPVGPFIRMVPPGERLPVESMSLQSVLDGRVCQRALLSTMVFSISQILATVAGCMTLEPGDLVFMGTPSGVAPLHPGSVVHVEIEGYPLGRLTTPILPEGRS